MKIELGRTYFVVTEDGDLLEQRADVEVGGYYYMRMPRTGRYKRILEHRVVRAKYTLWDKLRRTAEG